MERFTFGFVEQGDQGKGFVGDAKSLAGLLGFGHPFELVADRHAHDQVAHIDKESRQHNLRRTGVAQNHAGRHELAGAGEHEDRHGNSFSDGQVRFQGQRAKGDGDGHIADGHWTAGFDALDE